MADQAPSLKANVAKVRFERDRFAAVLNALENMASGQVDARLPISQRHDALDAIAYCVNVVVDELGWAGARAREAQEVKAAELRDAVVSAEAGAKRAAALIHDLAGRLIARQEAERQRIARELHDDVCQRIALLNVEIDQLAAEVDSQQTRARVSRLSARSRAIASDLHQMSYHLHPSRLRTIGLVAALQSLCRDVSAQRNLRVGFAHDAIPQSVDANVSLCLYRIAQEALHNVARHSGAREAQVGVTSDEAHVTLQITDSGVGFDPRHVAPGGLGLVGMQERVALLKGQLTINAVPGGGTQITVRIPLADG